MKAATGVTRTNGDRTADFRDLLVTFGVPRPVIGRVVKTSADDLTLTFAKDAGGVNYRVEGRPGLSSGSWTLIDAAETSNPDGTCSVVLPTAGQDQKVLRLRVDIP